MNKILRNLLTLIATFIIANATANDESRKLVCSSTYGDPQVQTSLDVCTAKKQYFYDAQGNIQAEITFKTEQGTTNFVTVDYYTYIYNSTGQLQRIDAFQYGAFDFLQRGMKASKAASCSYEYDAKGNLTKEITAGVTTTYEYDAEGNIIKSVASTGKTVTYEDFSAGKNKYAKAISTHTSKNNEGEFYDEYVTYDAKGNKLAVLRKYNTDTSYTLFGKQYGHLVGDFMSYETWTYDEDNILQLYMKSLQQDKVSGDYIWSTKTAYERIEGNANKIRRTNYDARYEDGVPVWSRRGTMFVDEYCSFTEAAMQDGLSLSVAVSKAGYGINNLTVTIPQAAIEAGATGINIYRNGELIKKVSKISTSVTIEDSGVRIGEQEYFVTLTIAGKEYASYCCSNKAVATMDIPLPKATRLYVADKIAGANGTIIVTIGFRYEGDPENAAFGYKETFLIINGGGYPDDNKNAVTTNPKQRTLKRDFEANQELTAQVATRYALGTVLSEPFAFNPSTVEITTNILAPTRPANSTEYYDLQGRRIQHPRGVVIMKGKMVIE